MEIGNARQKFRQAPSKKKGFKKKPWVFDLSEREKAIVQNWEALPGLPAKLTAVVESCGMSTVNDRLARGEYQAVQ